ncbi:hypothetical protein HZI73_18815 [Vallitalea pronyensis]|uniref:Uncharacterized protein n=1 Tax=Vallitalea pronyensis TaxID=1348613 RepID=A0A8J8MMK3_9FIRM|nr:hypothetical protein [Vallitalea pronyensis]QUI24217.1 hypothetical protein HZI73_18815 [Vallitalea pronyensis]
MAGIKFNSKYGMACGWELNKIVKKVKENAIESEWSITDLIDFYNILKYIHIKQFSDYIVQKTDIEIRTYEKKIHHKIGHFINKYKNDYINFHDNIASNSTDDFWEIFEKYKLYKKVKNSDFRAFLNKDNVHVYSILKFKQLAKHFDSEIKEVILTDSSNAKIILSKYIKEDNLYLPSSLTETEIYSLIDEYIDSPQVNINTLRQIITYPVGKGLNIPDKIKLHAMRKEKIEESKLFNDGTGIKTRVMISYPNDQEEVVIITMNDNTANINISLKWIKENLDYPTLWNNFIYIFSFVDIKMRLQFVSKTSDMGVLESLMHPKEEHLYTTSFSFRYNKMLSNAEIYSYIKVLNDFDIRLEDMIEWFFSKYLKDEFKISNFIVKMPSKETSYFEKCRTILPEIDRIFKQYNLLVEDGFIDQELIQMSSSSVKSKDIKSLIEKKYVYSTSDWYKRASHLLFSDQSSIFYMPNKEDNYENFLDLMISEHLKKNDFEEYQLQDMEWLFENNLICEDKEGYLEFIDQKVIYILKELFYEEVINYWHYPDNIRRVIEGLYNQNFVNLKSSLFSKNEQDYFDYYLNKSKFTNGHDIRNKYLHGTNSNNEKQYKTDYHIILKLIVIVVIKINDDLCIKEDYMSNSQ